MNRYQVVIATIVFALCSTGCDRVQPPAVQEASAVPGVQASEPAAALEQQPPPAVELANTAVFELVADGSGRTYPVWVDVPASYADSDKPLPVVFLTDAGYSFPLVRSIRNLLGQRGRNIEDFILVGLLPEQGLSSKESRNRDFTPSNPLLDPQNQNKPHAYSTEHYGEAAAYRDFIEGQVFPLIAQRYRADMSRKVFAGHSLGGLFGAYVMLTRPSMFQHYILGSPSFWFHQRGIYRFEEDYARQHQDLPAKVMMYIGSYETLGPGPRHFRNTDMVGQMQQFERKLQSRGYPGLSIDSQVIGDEDHLTVYPALISRGLLWSLPGSGHYFSG